MVVAGEVGEENVQHVFVDRDMVHITIVVSDIDPLQFLP